MHFSDDGGPLLADAGVDAESALQMTSPPSSFHPPVATLQRGNRRQLSRHFRFVDEHHCDDGPAGHGVGAEGGGERGPGERSTGEAGRGGQRPGTRAPAVNSFNDAFERIDGIAAVPLVELSVALEALRAVLGDVIDEKVRYALWWAGWFFEEEGEDGARNPYGLTLDEVAAIMMYTMEFRPSSLYAELNRALRSARRAAKLQPFFMYIRLFLTALYKLPTRKITLYRGMKTTIEAVGYQSNSRTIFWGFTSATPSARVLESPQFLGTSGNRILFHITSNCVDISPYSEFGSAEDERLIEAGTALKIGDILHLGNGLVQVKMEEDPDAQSPFDFGPPADRIHEEEAEVEEIRRMLSWTQKRYAKYACAFTIQSLVLLLVGLALGVHFFRGDQPGILWTRMAHLQIPVADAGPTAVVLNGSIFVVGGFRAVVDGFIASNKVQVFDGNAWTISEHLLPMRLAGHAAVGNASTLYVTGGYAPNSTSIGTRSVQAFDGGGWKLAANMTTARAGHCVSVFNGELYALGGDKVGNSVEVFDGAQWRNSVPMLHRRSFSFATVVADFRLYALGGYGTSTVESFDGTSWREEAPMELVVQREGINAVFFRGKILVFGATVIQAATLQDDGRLLWMVQTQANSFWIPGQLYMAGCVYENKYWAMGGGDFHSEPSNETWAFDLRSLY